MDATLNPDFNSLAIPNLDFKRPLILQSRFQMGSILPGLYLCLYHTYTQGDHLTDNTGAEINQN